MSWRGSLRGALAALALFVLAFMLWQLIEQFRETQGNHRQRSIDNSVQMADRLALNMGLGSKIALNVLAGNATQETPEQRSALVETLRRSLPALRSIAWVTATGEVTADTAENADDAEALKQSFLAAQGLPFY